jgi:hypothetical protein
MIDRHPEEGGSSLNPLPAQVLEVKFFGQYNNELHWLQKRQTFAG